jgi:hypothetical protein
MPSEYRQPRCTATIHEHSGFSFAGHVLNSEVRFREWITDLRPQTLVIKPVRGSCGHGVMVFESIAYEHDKVLFLSVNTSEARELSDIVGELRKVPEGCVLEERLQQHGFMNALNPSALNTIRVFTFMDKRNDVGVQAAVLRLGRQGCDVDNWDQGGLSVDIDVTNGRLGEGVTKQKYGGERFIRHPDTNSAFAGETVPMWDDVVSLCTRAAVMIPMMRWVGWDVAITPSGPVLVEGNAHPHVGVVQVHGRPFLTDDMIGKLGEYGIEFRTDRLPPVDLRFCWQVLIKSVCESLHT